VRVRNKSRTSNKNPDFLEDQGFLFITHNS